MNPLNLLCICVESSPPPPTLTPPKQIRNTYYLRVKSYISPPLPLPSEFLTWKSLRYIFLSPQWMGGGRMWGVDKHKHSNDRSSFICQNFLLTHIYSKDHFGCCFCCCCQLFFFKCIFHQKHIIVVYWIIDHPKVLISHRIYITGYFSKWIKIIYKWNVLFNECLTEKVRVFWILSYLFLSI